MTKLPADRNLIDLRSDTVTKPTPDMLEAMFTSPVGDDVYGEDPTITKLEEEVAQLLGKEAALFVPTGTMSNQLAIALHTRPGESVIAEADSHFYLYEAGATAAFSGVQIDLLPRQAGFSDAAIEAHYKADGLHSAASSLLIVENTHTRNGGRVLPAVAMRRIAKKARDLNLHVHCDGARLWNAAVATGSSERDLIADFDTVSVCFSKGLGAPVGSALVGSRALIERGRKLRKRWGGGMRQAGYLAGAALYALHHNRARLKIDHEHARLLATALEDLGKQGVPVELDYPELASNIVYFRLGAGSAADLAARLKTAGILCSQGTGGWLRAVTHLHITSADMERVIVELTRLLKR